MTMMEGLELLDQIVDESDPDVSLASCYSSHFVSR